MEFRIFVPLLGETNGSWIAPELISEYSAACQTIRYSLFNTTTPIEEREDTYFLGHHFYGLKFRGKNNKLEIKIMSQKYSHKGLLCEHWQKHEFGKKGVLHYEADIKKLISASPISSSITTNIGDIDFNTLPLVSILKRRQKVPIPNYRVDQEISIIKSPSQLHSSSAYANSGPSPEENYWISYSVEGVDYENIVSYIRQNHDLECIWNAAQLAIDIYTHDPLKARSASFIPVVGGYPLWLPFACGQETNFSHDASNATLINQAVDDTQAVLNEIKQLNVN